MPAQPETAAAEQDQTRDGAELEHLDPDYRQRHTHVDGALVVSDVPVLSGLINSTTGEPVPIKGIRVLSLADGRRAYTCRDCDHVGTASMVDKDLTPVVSTRGEIRKHRYEEHGAAKGGAYSRRRREEPQGEVPGHDPAVVTMPIDPAAMALELGEIFELAMEVSQHERMYATVLADRDHWKREALAAQKELRSIHRALGKFVPAPGEQKTGS